MTEENGLE